MVTESKPPEDVSSVPRSRLGSRRGQKDVELAALTNRIHDIELEILSSARSYHQSLTAQVRSINVAIYKQRRTIARIPKREIESARLRRQVNQLEELFRFLETQLQEAEVAEALTLPGVHVVGKPFFPYKASFPRKEMTFALASMLGLGVGLLVGLLLDRADHKLRNERELRTWGVPILAFIPRLRGRFTWPFANGVEYGLRKSNAKQAMDALRAHSLDIQAATMGPDRIRTIAVTSPDVGEGKTLCALNLAREVSQDGKATLLIDADFRQRGLTQAMNIQLNQPSLAELIEQRHEIKSTLSALMVSTVEGISLIHAGLKRQAPAWLQDRGLEWAFRLATEPRDCGAGIFSELIFHSESRVGSTLFIRS